jgi:hypothetical protein
MYYFNYSEKDIDCDIRENIINYEDEGGGEGDQTGYDLSVLRMMADGTAGLHPMSDKMIKPTHEPPPDIQTFLQTNKVEESLNFFEVFLMRCYSHKPLLTFAMLYS